MRYDNEVENKTTADSDTDIKRGGGKREKKALLTS